MGEFLTWGNFLTWVICSFLIYISLNFRLYMVFHHPGRKLKAKVRAKKELEKKQDVQYKPGTQKPVWNPDCLPNACYSKSINTDENRIQKS